LLELSKLVEEVAFMVVGHKALVHDFLHLFPCVNGL
jgi:hypothetical protein